MSAEPLVARGGFAPPTITYGEVTGGVIAPARGGLAFALPMFRAWSAHIFGDPVERWAHDREKELRDQRRSREAEAEIAAVEWPFEFPTYRRDP